VTARDSSEHLEPPARPSQDLERVVLEYLRNQPPPESPNVPEPSQRST